MTKIIPFLETFWTLADESPELRAKSAQSLLVHCFYNQSHLKLDENADNEDKTNKTTGNEKTEIAFADCAYALRRLLDGLNSGRASARQGFASCLTSFLRMAFAKEAFRTIRNEMNSESKSEDEPEMDDFTYLRKELIKKTSTTIESKKSSEPGAKKQKKKNSEERDCAFGRLFGILAICRSEILIQAPSEVILDFVKDILTLYQWRKWMREPCAHAIIELMDSLVSSETGKIKATLVAEKLIIPEFLRPTGSFAAAPNEDHDDSTTETKTIVFVPESIGVALYIERQLNIHVIEQNKSLILNSNSALDEISRALISTSSATTITVPDPNESKSKTKPSQRRHFVWKQIFQLYLSCNSDKKKQSKILCFIFKQFLEQNLLCSNTKITTERKTLALALVLDYATLQDDISPSPQMISDYVLTPTIIQKLFLNTIAASAGHILKQMASYVLESITNICTKSSKIESSNSKENKKSSRSLGLIQAFILAEPKFDTRTKSKTTSSLICILGQSELSQLFDFLEYEIIKRSLSTSTSTESISFVEGLLNVYSNLHKTIAHDTPFGQDTSFMEPICNRIIGFLLAGAFFNNNDIKSTKEQQNESIAHEALDAARRIQNASSKDAIIRYPIRRIMSDRFFSVLSDLIATDFILKEKKQTKISHKTENAFQTLSSLLQQWEHLEQNHAKRYTSKNDSDMDIDEDEDEDETPMTMEELKKQITRLQALSRDLLVTDQNNSTNELTDSNNVRAIVGCTTLLLSLYVQLLRCGSNETDDNGIQDEEEQEEEEEEEGIGELLNDLIHVINSVLENKPSNQTMEDKKDENINALALLTDICVSSLSLFEKTSSSSRSTKMLRDTTKMAWTGSLIAATSSKKVFKLNEQVMELILESICGSESMSENDNEDDDMEGSDNESEDEVQMNFNEVMESGVDISDADAVVEQTSKSSDEGQQSEDEDKDDVELDPSQLQSLLLEDDDQIGKEDDEGEFQLEHHAGADAALAQMIKLKRESRKQAQDEKYRIEFNHRLRCLTLLESIFSTHGDSSSSTIFENDGVVLMTLLPILKARRSLEKAISHDDIGKKGGLMSAKKALLERLTSIYKNKICKIKFVSKGDYDTTKSHALEIFNETKKSLSVMHCSCCSLALLLTLKQIDDFKDQCALVRTIYESAAEDWSTRKATKFHTVFFEDIITRFPELSRTVLVSSMIGATKNGRSLFLKSEAFRLLSKLFQLNSSDYSNESSVLKSLQESIPSGVTAVNDALENEDFRKSKRSGDVVKASENIVGFWIEHCEAIESSHQVWESLEIMSNRLASLSSITQNQGIKRICDKLVEDITNNKAKSEKAIGEASSKKDGNKTTKNKKKKRKSKK